MASRTLNLLSVWVLMVLSSFQGIRGAVPVFITDKYEAAQRCLYTDEDSALLYINEVYDYAVLNKEPVLEAKILLLKAEMLIYQGEMDEVLSICSTVREIAQNRGDRHLLVAGQLLEGYCYTDLDMFDKAYSTLSSALNMARQINDTTEEIKAYLFLGILYDLQADTEQAVSFFKKGLQLAEYSGNAILKIRLLNSLSITYVRQDKLEDAKHNLLDCIRYVEANRLTYGLDRLYINMALVMSSTDQLDSALFYARHALETAKRHANRSSIAKALIYNGHILFLQDSIAEAKAMFGQADSLALILGAQNMHCIILEYYAEMAKAEGAFKDAYIYLEAFKRCSDSLTERRNILNMLRLQMENETAQTEMVSQYKLYRLTLLTIIIAFVLVLGAIFFGYEYRRHRRHEQNARQNARLERQRLVSELEQGNKKMVTQSIYRQKKNKDLSEIAEKLRLQRAQFKPTNQPLIDDVISSLDSFSGEERWEDFEIYFERVHTGFMKNLQKKYPDLSLTEKKLCVYLRLGMTTKEIANIQHISFRAVEQARYRLRKKLGLKKEEDLVNFLNKFDE